MLEEVKLALKILRKERPGPSRCQSTGVAVGDQAKSGKLSEPWQFQLGCRREEEFSF